VTSFLSAFFTSALAVSFVAKSSVTHPSFRCSSTFSQFSSFATYLIRVEESMTFTVLPHRLRRESRFGGVNPSKNHHACAITRRCLLKARLNTSLVFLLVKGFAVALALCLPRMLQVHRLGMDASLRKVAGGCVG